MMTRKRTWRARFYGRLGLVTMLAILWIPRSGGAQGLSRPSFGRLSSRTNPLIQALVCCPCSGIAARWRALPLFVRIRATS